MFKNEVENIVKNKRFFGTLAWLGAGWLAGVPSGVTAPVLGPIDSRLQDWRLLAVDWL